MNPKYPQDGKAIPPPTDGTLTWYQGYYICKRDGKRVGVTWVYNNVDGMILNEREVSVVVLSS